MKTNATNRAILPALTIGLGFLLAGRAAAQTFTNLHGFTGSDGADPLAGVILSGNTLYGTTQGGDTSAGTVFAINTDGTGFTNLHSFGGSSNSDAFPDAGLVLSGNTLYGTATETGSYGSGAVFAINTNGGGFTNLYVFTNGCDGANPEAGLTLSGNTLYGTTYGNGDDGPRYGSVFAVNTDGTGFTNLHDFSAPSDGFLSPNSDGANPQAGLILSGNTLYGTTYQGGASGHGSVFAVNTDGTGFTNLYSFTAPSDGFPYANCDGTHPLAGLILSGNTLYGTASQGGGYDGGTLFAVNTNGTGFTNLHSFTATSGPTQPNGDGNYPMAGLVLSGNTLYGTAAYGGSGGSGAIFAVNTDGTGFTNLYSFTAQVSGANSDGANPMAGLILSGNTLYGTSYWGGSENLGTVFALTLPVAASPQLTIILSGTNIVLTWPANAAGFTLQSTADLSSASWNPVSPAPVVVNGQNTVTNPIGGTQQFYELIQP